MSKKVVDVFRWIVFIPAGIIASFFAHNIVRLFYGAAYYDFAEIDPIKIIGFVLSSAAIGAAFMYAAFYVAPEKNVRVVNFLFGFAMLMFGGLLVLAIIDYHLTAIAQCIIAVIATYMSVDSICKGIEKN